MNYQWWWPGNWMLDLLWCCIVLGTMQSKALRIEEHLVYDWWVWDSDWMTVVFFEHCDTGTLLVARNRVEMPCPKEVRWPGHPQKARFAMFKNLTPGWAWPRDRSFNLEAVVSIVWVGTKSTSPTSNPETTASPFVLRRCLCIPAPQVLSIQYSQINKQW